MIDSVFAWIRGDLSPTARVVTAAGPALLIVLLLLAGAGVFALRNARRGPFHDSDVEARGSTLLIGMWLRRYFAWLMQPLLALLIRMRLPPNAITTLSLLLATAAAVAVAAGRMALGGWLFVASSLCDFLDGRLARHAKTAGPDGAVLDSVLDRYVEGAIFIGLAWFYRDSWVLIAVLLALLGSLLVPYVRARGEALGVPFHNVGMVQRPERVVVLGLSLALSPVVEVLVNPADPRPVHRLAVIGIVLLAAATQISALQRLFHARRFLSPRRARSRALGRGGIVRNAIAGGVATGADFALVVAMVTFASVSPPLATLAGCVLGAVVNFSVNRVWAFGSTAPGAPQAGRYLVVTASSALLNGGLVAVFLLLPDLPYQLAWVLVRGAVFVTWNFPLHRDYVFLHARDASAT